MTIRSAVRICLLATVVICLDACERRADKLAPNSASSTPSPATAESVSAPAPAPEAPQRNQAGAQVPPVAKEPSTPPATPPSARRGSTAVKPPAANPPVAKAPTVTTAVPAPPAAKSVGAPDAPPPLDLAGLEQQLRSTKAIGVFSKIALKNQVDDLMKQFREHYKGKTPPTMMELRTSYDLLIMKVLSMVQDHDQRLASAILSSRAAIWDLLADPKKFAALDV